jgi:hypothetical protein
MHGPRRQVCGAKEHEIFSEVVHNVIVSEQKAADRYDILHLADEDDQQTISEARHFSRQFGGEADEY